MGEKKIQIKVRIECNIDKEADNNQWKQCLKEYKKYTKAYIKHYKKAVEGNRKSIIKYPDLKSKSEAIYLKLFDAQNKALLTNKQINKMHRIHLKIAKSCLN